MAQAEMPLKILELNHIALNVRDLERLVHFYGTVLGLPAIPRPDFNFAGAWFALGSQELHLIVDTSENEVLQPRMHFALLVENSARAAEELMARGITGLRGPAPRPDGAVQTFLQDPDGHQVELVSYP